MKRFWAFVAVLFILTGCATKKFVDKSVVENHVDSTSVASNVTHNDITETTDKNTVKTIVITEYVTVYDTITKSYPVKSVTEIKEENKDKVVKEDKSVSADSTATAVSTDNSVHNDIQEEKKQNASNYIWTFLAGMAAMLILILAIKLGLKYLKAHIGIA